MKIVMPKWAKAISILLVFVAAVCLGLLLESLRNDAFRVESVSVENIDAQSASENEAMPEMTASATEAAAEIAASTEASYSVSSDMVNDGKININTASKELLMEINGIGESLATRIIEYRTQNGPFESIEEIVNVSGIGQKKLENMRDMICVE